MGEYLTWTLPYNEYRKLNRLKKFRWFVMSSKIHMGYPGYGGTISRLVFWRRFPRAAFKYWRLSRNG